MTWLLPPALFLLTVAAMGLACWGLGSPHSIPAPWHWLGLLPLVAGLALAQAGKRLFRRRGTQVDTFAAPGTLVVDGPYRWTRNPMYLGMAAAALGAAVLLHGAPSSFGLAALFAVVADRWYVRHEERALEEAFGEAWRAYKRRVRRWV